MGDCTSMMVPRIEREMREYTQKLIGPGPMPFWAKSAMRQHAEYAAGDWCAARGLQGLGAEPERPTFPSVQAVYDLKDGKEGAFVDVVKWTAIRAVLIGAGLFIGGDRSLKSIAVKSVISSALVEAFVIGYIEVQERKAKKSA
jgi:hypothetical protein